MEVTTLNGYKLSRLWFDWAFENARVARPVHGILFLWICEKANRLGWPKEFQLPSDEACAACCTADRETILKAISDLEKWGFIKVVQQSKNRFTARWIRIAANNKEVDGSLDSALLLHPKKSDAMPNAISDAIPNAIPNAIPTNINHKQKTSKQLNFDFVEKEYSECFFDWIDYKKEKKNSYKSQKSIEYLYKNLKEISGFSPAIAKEIVFKAIANNWAGLHKPSEKKTTKMNDTHALHTLEGGPKALARFKEDVA